MPSPGSFFDAITRRLLRNPIQRQLDNAKMPTLLV